VTRSLSGRLLLGVVSLVVIGLLILDAAIYTSLQAFLTSRVDDQLLGAHNTAVSALGGPSEGAGPQASGGLPEGTIVELVSPNGTALVARRLQFAPSTSKALPQLPQQLPSAPETAPAIFTLAGTAGVEQYRVAIWQEDLFQGETVVLAIPLTEVVSTLHQLQQLELLISLGVVGAMAIFAFVIIRVSLRPLEKMGSVAREIAAGDLSRRVEPATKDTEIGRLGLALNGMLGQIESAFAERTQSENRLRRFIADASHELRTPLTSVRGYAEMLRRGAEKSPEDSALARRRIEEEAKRMSVMVDDMLVLARLGQGRPLEMQPVDLQVIARDAVADAHAVAPQREISLDAPNPVIVAGDDTRLRQALGNLVRNALVHTPPETPIEVAVGTENGLAHVTVSDHGPGLGADDAKRVFEPFYRADPSRSRYSGGVGLGLSIVAAVAGAHGGQATAKETPGGGATFELELPSGSAQA